MALGRVGEAGRLWVAEKSVFDQSLKPCKVAVKAGGRGEGCEDLPSSSKNVLSRSTACS